MMSINLDTLKAFAARLKPKPSDVLGLDVASSGIKAARVRRNTNGSLTLLGVEILPGVALQKKPGEAAGEIQPLKLPRHLVAKHAAIAVTGENAVVKLLSFPGRADTIANEIDAKVMAGIALDTPENYRVGYKLLAEGQSKLECRALAVAVPEAEARSAYLLLPTGLPAPHSIEISGLAAMTAFLQIPEVKNSNDALGMLEFGSSVSFFAIFNKRVPVLVRRFDIGSSSILAKVQESLGVDMATAEGILADGSFDISQQMDDVMSGFVKQIMVSRDFVERRENCRISKVYVSGGTTRSRDWLTELKSALGYDVSLWNPFETLQVGDGVLPDSLKGHESRFAASIGACLATLMEATS